MRRFSIFAVLAALGTALPIFTPDAIAHAYLRRAIPAAGSTVSSPPTEVDCFFTEDLEPNFSTLEVQNAAGNRVDAGNKHLAPGDAKKMIVELTTLEPGTYTVIWHAVSVDTHHTQGHFTFTIAH